MIYLILWVAVSMPASFLVAAMMGYGDEAKTCLAVVYENGDVFIDSTVKTAQDYSHAVSAGQKAEVKRVTVAESKKRSLDQNALYHVGVSSWRDSWVRVAPTVKQMLKIKFGFPVLFQNEEKGKQLKWILKRLAWNELSWQQKLNLCGQWIPVTSAMSTAELREMMNNIKEWAMSEYNITLDNGKRD